MFKAEAYDRKNKDPFTRTWLNKNNFEHKIQAAKTD